MPATSVPGQDLGACLSTDLPRCHQAAPGSATVLTPHLGLIAGASERVALGGAGCVQLRLLACPSVALPPGTQALSDLSPDPPVVGF